MVSPATFANPRAHRPPAFIQVDVDGLWAVRACYGRPVRDTFRRDPVWTQGVEGLRRMFDELRIPATFFLVGRDLGLPAKVRLARALADDGHELANHSHTHVLGLTRRPVGVSMEEIRRAHEAFLAAGLPAPCGFRAPGYDVDSRVLRAVRRMGYLYDSSILPTRLGPLLRVADAVMARRWDPRKRQFGRFSYGSAPKSPYFPSPYRVRKPRAHLGQSRLLELPVTTIAPLGFPMTGSAIFAFGPRHVKRALDPARRFFKPLVMVLHGIDLVDCRKPVVLDDRTVSAGGFDRSADSKAAAIREVLEYVRSHYDLRQPAEWAGRYGG
jgi:hypothetical protein